MAARLAAPAPRRVRQASSSGSGATTSKCSPSTPRGCRLVAEHPCVRAGPRHPVRRTRRRPPPRARSCRAGAASGIANLPRAVTTVASSSWSRGLPTARVTATWWTTKPRIAHPGEIDEPAAAREVRRGRGCRLHGRNRVFPTPPGPVSVTGPATAEGLHRAAQLVAPPDEGGDGAGAGCRAERGPARGRAGEWRARARRGLRPARRRDRRPAGAGAAGRPPAPRPGARSGRGPASASRRAARARDAPPRARSAGPSTPACRSASISASAHRSSASSRSSWSRARSAATNGTSGRPSSASPRQRSRAAAGVARRPAAARTAGRRTPRARRSRRRRWPDRCRAPCAAPRRTSGGSWRGGRRRRRPRRRRRARSAGTTRPGVEEEPGEDGALAGATEGQELVRRGCACTGPSMAELASRCACPVAVLPAYHRPGTTACQRHPASPAATRRSNHPKGTR